MSRHVFRMPLAQPERPEQAAGHGAERDLRVRDGDAPGGLPGLDVPQSGAPAAGRVQGLQADASQEPGDIGCVRPSRPEIRSETANTSAGSLTSAQAWSITCPSCSSNSPDAVPNSCSLLSKWL